jgi:hypothetical protein
LLFKWLKLPYFFTFCSGPIADLDDDLRLCLLATVVVIVRIRERCYAVVDAPFLVSVAIAVLANSIVIESVQRNLRRNWIRFA